MRHLIILALLISQVSFASGRLNNIKSYLVYYGGDWSQQNIDKTHDFDLVIIHPGKTDKNIHASLVYDIKVGRDGRLGTADDVKVIAYLSLGEDERVESGPRELKKTHRGPVQRNKNGSFEFTNNGFRNWLLDETAFEFDKDGNKIWGEDGLPKTHIGHDKSPDENGKWNSYYVNVSDPDWQKHIKSQMDLYLTRFGCDGVFLDTIDTASPWGPYGWMQQDMVDVLVKIRGWAGNKIVVMNRGLFLFETFGEILNKHVDAVMFESFVSEWDWYAGIGLPNRWYFANQDILANQLRKYNSRKNGIYILFLNYYDSEQPESFLFDYELARRTAGFRAAHYVSDPGLQVLNPPKVFQKQTPKSVLTAEFNNKQRTSVQPIKFPMSSRKKLASLWVKKINEPFSRDPFLLPVSNANGQLDLSELEAGNYEVELNSFLQDGPISQTTRGKISIQPNDQMDHPETFAIRVGDTQLSLDWKSVAGANDYVILWGNNRFGLANSTKVIGKTHHVFKGLKNGTTYFFKVAALQKNKKQGRASAMNFATPTDTTAPKPPVLLSSQVKVTLDGKCVVAKWQPSSSGDTSRYKLYLDPINLTRGIPVSVPRSKRETCLKTPKPGRYKLALSAVDGHNNESKLTKTVMVDF